MFIACPAPGSGWSSLAAIRSRVFTTFAAALALVGSACGGSGGHTSSQQTGSAAHTTGSVRQHTASRSATRRSLHQEAVADSVTLRYRPLYTLRAPLRDPAYTVLGGDRFAMLGGLDGADVSVAGIEIADLHRVLHTGALPGPQHDAQAALLGSRVYVFGGGYTTELDHILMYDPSGGQTSPAGTLSVPQSDVAVTQAGGTAYVVGGFDGTTYLSTVVAWRPGSKPAVVAHVPEGLRYAAVTIAGAGLYVLGGVTPAGTSDAIYRFDLTTHRVRRIGTLPHPTEHGNAVTLGSTVYLVGGRGASDTDQTSAVYAVDPATGRVRPAGRLPKATSDAAVMAIGRAVVVAGGQSPTGTLAGVGELVPAGG
jgi:Galactose oxidase, central domain